MRLPSSIFVSVSLFTAETTAALYLSSTYRSAGDQIWQALTLLFTLIPSVLVQLTLTFIHRDLSRDRPLVLLLHLLQLGPIVRCLEAFCIYGSVGRVEEPYVSITRKKQIPRGGQCEEVERQVGQAEGKLFTHRAAFARTSVIQAFLGSAPQLTLQLYICVLQGGVSVGRGTLMVISLLSIVYGALRCNILAIKIKYDDYEVDIRPMAYLCIFLWRSFEIATRVAVLVLFSSVLQLWVLPVVLLNFLVFFLYPWILFWLSHSPFPENIEKTLTRVGTTIVLCLLTFLYAGINMFCWSAVQVKLNDPDLINKSQNWYRMAVYYMLRFVENASLLLLCMTRGFWNCSSLLCLVCCSDPPPNRLTAKSALEPRVSPEDTEQGGNGAPNTAGDTADDLPNDTTYDILCNAIDDPSSNRDDGINGDLSCHTPCKT
ncbi:membrane transport protein XK isoform X1 [Takifugu rubripes]|uniref:membrane transport protein XK isoform X1 n=1 Tax=Takifugu rubripes TaxID=31033 RepID=UPI0011453D49|nr:membrane transport protein XK isoform X1 [Takifugu rubripes]